MVQGYSAKLLHYRECDNNDSCQETGNQTLCWFFLFFFNLFFWHCTADVDDVAEDISQTNAFTVK